MLQTTNTDGRRRACMRNRMVAAAAGALLCACLAAAGCAGSAAPSSAAEGTETEPRLMPAQHQKYVDRPAYKCYRCHGASEQGNPSVENAVAMPDGHYVDNDPGSFELDPLRTECRSCHAVDPGKQREPGRFQDAEVESGQDGLDEGR